MNCFLAQIIFLARNGDRGRGGWMQLLVIAFLAIFYLLGSILKAKSNKLDEEGEEAGEQKGGPKPAEGVRGRRLLQKLEEVIEEQIQRPAGRPRPEEQGPQVVPAQRKVKRPVPKGREFVAVKKLEDKYADILAETPEAKSIVEPLLDYDEPDKLKRAILHYEILGKPMSLRGPSEHIIGL